MFGVRGLVSCRGDFGRPGRYDITDENIVCMVSYTWRYNASTRLRLALATAH